MKELVIKSLGLNRDGILLDKRIPKSTFFELESFNSEKKRIFTDEISQVSLLAILNEDTINIAPYKDEQVNYNEVCFIYIDLKVKKNIFAITEVIQKNIGNPCFLIFAHGDCIQIQTTIKRLSKSEQGKQVLEKEFYSEWIDMKNPGVAEQSFISKLNIANYSFENLFVFYNEYTRLIYQSVFITILGEFRLYRKLDMASLDPYIENYLKQCVEEARLKAEQIKTLDFGERVTVQNKVIKVQKEKVETKQRLITFLDTQQ